MGPPSHSASHLRTQDGEGTSEELFQEPEGQEEYGRDVKEKREEKDWDHDNDPGLWKEYIVGAHDTCNGTGGTYGGYGRIRVGIDVDHRCHESTHDIENEKPPGAHLVFHIVSKYPQRPHIANDMDPASMEEHTGEKGEDGSGREPHGHCPVRMGISCWDHAIEISEMLE